MDSKQGKGPRASRRGFLTGLVAGAGATAALSAAHAQSAAKPAASGPVLFRRNAET
jgi:hypothetical protein